MKVVALEIPEIRLIMPPIRSDDRGFFSEVYNARDLEAAGVRAHFVQDNHTRSLARGVVRGFHFQSPPHAQDKLVRVARGAIQDVVVDIRHGSPTFGRSVSVLLSEDNWQQLWVPQGFAHGFCTLEPNTEVLYKVSAYHAREHDHGLAWDDPVLGIDWLVAPGEAILSSRDRNNPTLAALPRYFSHGA